MKLFLLDCNVLSELWKPVPHPGVLAWIEQAEWLLPVPVIAEIQEGAEATASATRKAQINSKLEDFLAHHASLVIDWDAQTARTWARLKHSPEVKRKPQPLWDSLIDAMAVRHDAIVATRNQTDFRHAETFSPWDYAVGSSS